MTTFASFLQPLSQIAQRLLVCMTNSHRRVFEFPGEESNERQINKMVERYEDQVVFDRVSFVYTRAIIIMTFLAHTVKRLPLSGPTGAGKDNIVNL